MTADHTPERLSAEERWMQDRRGESVHLWTPACPSLGCIDARRVPRSAYDALAAHLADVEARLAAWHSWAGTWLADYPDGETPRMRELRAALHPDPSEPA